MALLKRADWYDIARSTNWSPTYVTEDELFPRSRAARWVCHSRAGMAMTSPIR